MVPPPNRQRSEGGHVGPVLLPVSETRPPDRVSVLRSSRDRIEIAERPASQRTEPTHGQPIGRATTEGNRRCCVVAAAGE